MSFIKSLINEGAEKSFRSIFRKLTHLQKSINKTLLFNENISANKLVITTIMSNTQKSVICFQHVLCVLKLFPAQAYNNYHPKKKHLQHFFLTL